MGIFATVNSSSAIHSKSTDKRKPIMSFKEGAADDREEGEIIDEYEDIISSDEEFSMRLRIKELEAKNAELEKIANISAIYASESYDYTKKDSSNHHVDRYPLISIDISDEEGYPPPPSMTRITKRRKSLQHFSSRGKMIHTTTNGGRRRRKKSSSPPPPPPYHPSDKLLLSMFHEKYAERSSSKKRRKSKKSHSNKPTRKAREYQYASDDYTLDTYNLDVGDGYDDYKSSDAEASFPINRDELRLALARNTHSHEQHISLKDRLIRRKENTDTLNEKNVNDVQEIVEVDDNSDGPEDKPNVDDNMEEQELRIIALKSAVIRKHLVRKKRNENVAYSPSDFDEAYANISVSPSINIDEAEPCMEISPVPSPKIVVSDDDGIDTKPVDMDIVNSDSDCELSYEKWVPIQQIPLPNNLVMQNQLYVPTPLRYNTKVEHPHFMPPDGKFETALDSPVNLDSDVEEEELALRTLLLAKMNSPKVNKNVIEERSKIEERHSPDADTSLEAEALRDFLIRNMKKKLQPQNSSASVLKEAVRRLTARNVNASPMKHFVELSSIQNTCQSVSAFSMTLHEAENQLSRSTADLAKIQIGQPGIRVNNVRQEWTLYKSDEECSAVKFNLSSEKTKAESKYPTQSNKTERDEECGESSSFEGIVEGFLHDEVGPRKTRDIELQSESEGLYTKVYVSKKTDDDETKENGIQAVSLLKFVSTEDSQTLKVLEYQKESSLVPVASTENENQADISLNLKVCAADAKMNKKAHTIECQRQSVPEVKKSDRKRPKTGPSVPSPTESPMSDVALIKNTSTKPIDNSKNKLTDVKNGTHDIANQIVKSSATSSEVEIAIKESSTRQQSKVELSDAVKAGVKSVSPKKIKSLGTVFKSVPIQKKVTKNSPELNASKVEKTLTTVSPYTKAKENMPIQQQKKDAHSIAKIKEASSLSLAKGRKENTTLTNASSTTLQAKVEKTQNQITEQSFIPKPSHLVLSTHTFHPKLSVHPSTKIVKPNKVINTRVSDLKRPLSEHTAKTSVPAKLPKFDEPSNKLITTAEMPQVKKLVIQLRASDSESDYSALSADGGDDDDAGDLDARDTDFMNRSITIGNEYYDIASPISLPMESPCNTPTRTASPVASVATQPVVEKSIVNDFFEAQLDKFLKNVRSKVFESSKKPVDVNYSTTLAVSTPVAVRHLPEASQQEYRRLINRMKMLERQKQSKNLQVIVKNTDTVKSTETRTMMGDGESLVRKVLVKNASVNTATATCQTPQKHALQKPKTLEREKIIPPIADEMQKSKAPEKGGETNSTTVLPNMSLSTMASSTTDLAVPSCSLSKAVSTSSKTIPAPTAKPVPSTPNKSNHKLLALYEKSYRETGNSIISNLDRSIEMVTVAKKAKMEKLKHEHRLMELRKEMEEVQRLMRQHQERITKIYPEICNSHRMIETLKTRRVKIHKDVTAFGKRVIGQSYSMNNDQKPIILEKSKKLAAEIKFVNNMKMSNVEMWQNVAQPLQTDTAAIVLTPVSIPAIENYSHICRANDKVPVDDSKTNAIETSLPESILRIEPKLTHTIVPAKILSEPKKDEDITEQDPDQKKTTNGHEEALENERPVDNNKKTHNSKDDKEEKDQHFSDRDDDEQENYHEVCENEQMGGIKLQDYVSPLGHMRDKRQINPNGIVCPYQLMGQCGDKDCKYMHLDN